MRPFYGLCELGMRHGARRTAEGGARAPEHPPPCLHHCRRNHNLAKQILYSQVSSGTVSARLWGQHEADALASYKIKLDCGLTLNAASIFINECGFLGASSDDGVVTDHLECSVRLVEVKCPYKARNKSVEEMYDDPSVCCSVNGEPVLTQNYDYYYQVQGQMANTGVHV